MLNRVIAISVIGNAPVLLLFKKKGITEPFEPITLPYLTTENFIGLVPRMLLAAINNLSEASFVAPYKLMGAAALSVERATTFSTLASRHALIIFSAPRMFVFTHSIGLYSAIGTCFIAAA